MGLITWFFLVMTFSISTAGTEDHDASCSANWEDVTLGDTFNLTTPNYPLYYPPDLRCIWHLNSDDGLSFAIRFLNFATEKGSDILTIGNGEVSLPNTAIQEFSSLIPSHVVAVLESSAMWLTFYSDIVGSRSGIEIQIDRVADSVPCKDRSVWCDTGDTCVGELLLCSGYPECLEMSRHCSVCNDVDFQCISDLGCVEKSMVCDGIRQCLDGSDEWSCYQCGLQISNMSSSDPIYLTSPNYPQKYPPDLDCFWIFTETMPGTYVITFLDFETEWWDNLKIGTGETVEENIVSKPYNWYYPTAVLINDTAMWISFVSNDAVQFRGLFLEVNRIPEQVSCLEDEFQCVNGYGCVDPSLVCSVQAECYDWSDEWSCDYCPNTTLTVPANDEVLTINSPFYPLFYPDRLDCFWRISSEQPSGYIVLSFLAFALHALEDFLTIGVGSEIIDSAVIFRLSGGGAPRIVTVNASTGMWLRLTTNWNGQISNGFRFQLQWHEQYVGCYPDEFFCSSGFGCLDESLVCDSLAQCLLGSDEHGCDLCGDEQLNLNPVEYFNLTSPRYPTQYPLLQDCLWMITSPPEGALHIEFVALNTGLSYDKLLFAPKNTTIIFDGSGTQGTYLLFSGTAIPRALVTTHQEIQIAWDPSVWSLGSYTGFYLRVSWEKTNNATCEAGDFVCPVNIGLMCLHATQACDGRPLCPDDFDEQNCGQCGANTIYLPDDAGTPVNFTSPGFPLPYYPNLGCEWLIRAADDPRRIVIRIRDFHLEYGFDYLTFGNGDVFWRETIGSLTGAAKVTAISSSGSGLWLALHTDDTGNLHGYRLELEQVPVDDKLDVCQSNDFHCGSGFCITYGAKCDGFTDCLLNQADEARCAYIHCPGSYLCDKVPDVNISKCVTNGEVCDGDVGCPGADDETKCDIKRCPSGCMCSYAGDRLDVSCLLGWDLVTIADLARTSNTLKLSGAASDIVHPGIFKGLSDLHALSLDSNNINVLNRGAFIGLDSVSWLDLSNNNITSLHGWTFEDLPMMKQLYLLNVPLSAIFPDTFYGASMLTTLVIIRNERQAESILAYDNAFRGIEQLKLLYVDDHHICCHFSNLDECVTLEPQPPLFMCGSLMQNYGLRVSMWVLGISALIGNLFVVIVRVREKTKSSTQAKQSYLVTNLAISDSLMGVYMIILASTDLYYGDEYFVYSDQWRISNLCKFASFLSLLSCEASVFFVTLITVDRFICLVFPFSKYQFRKKSIRVAGCIMWVAALILGIVPTVYAGPDSDFYDLSDVCIGLPLITRPASYSIQSNDITDGLGTGRSFALPVPEEFKPAWYFSIAIFLGLNLVLFLTILVCYVIMFVNVKLMRQKVRSTNRNDELKIAIRMAAIVITDLLCWMPVIIMGILSQTGAVVIPLQMYTWSVVFIIPINSSLNPYLYTIASVITDRRQATEKKSDISMSGNTKSDIIN